jgi:hypothetical protein
MFMQGYTNGNSAKYRGFSVKREGPHLGLYSTDGQMITQIQVSPRYLSRISRSNKNGTKSKETLSGALRDPEVIKAIDTRLKRMGLLQ